jgi:hypothetical protein
VLEEQIFDIDCKEEVASLSLSPQAFCILLDIFAHSNSLHMFDGSNVIFCTRVVLKIRPKAKVVQRWVGLHTQPLKVFTLKGSTITQGPCSFCDILS